MAIISDIQEGEKNMNQDEIIQKKKPSSSTFVPNKGNGPVDMENYSRTQSLQVVNIIVPVPGGNKSRSVKVDDSFWSIEDSKVTKQNQKVWWKYLVQGEPGIHTQKVEPETRHLYDLDPETRSNVEKMMFDQRQSMGLQTKETKKRAYKRKDRGDTNTPRVTKIKQKRPYRRKDGEGKDTTTVKEINKKRPYKRKDCGDTDTPRVREIEQKRPYRRNDSDGKDTLTVTEINKKRPYKRKDSGGTDTPTVTEIKKKRPYKRKKYIPHDLIMEEILTKLPVRTLLKSVRVSKLWYNSIHNDHKRLTHSHFLQSQKQPDLIFCLLNVRVGALPPKFEKPQSSNNPNEEAKYTFHFFKFTRGIHNHELGLKFERFPREMLPQPAVWELVGYCNGLPCVTSVGKYSTTTYIIMDPNRPDILCIYYPVFVGTCTSDASIICHGFGFNPSTNEYKVVSIFRTAQKEVNVVVFTLGTKSWRNITPTSGHTGRPIIKIRVPTGIDRSAIICTTTSNSSTSGCLAWKVVATLGGETSRDIQHDDSNDVSNEMEMLLSFNLHDEKFEFIQLPAKSTTAEQRMHLLFNYPHLLQFKGSPCVARIEKISGNGSDYVHRFRDDNQGSSSSSCCCCCKVHLYVLKDQVKKEWVKEESFDVRIKSTPTWVQPLGNLDPDIPDPCCFCFGCTTTTPPTRIFCYSDQMLLYWFIGNCLQVYNLRSEKLQVVLPNHLENLTFQAKMKEPRHAYYSGDDNIYCPNMDYQLHCHEENLLSLETFIPEGVAGIAADVFDTLDLEQEDRPCSAYLYIYRGSKMYYPSFI